MAGAETKLYAVAPEGCCGYLTPGRRYEIAGLQDAQFKEFRRTFTVLEADNGERGLFCLEHHCAHLRGGSWAVVDGRGRRA